MKAGAGKAKGSAYEREVCKKLSLWVSNGKRVDCLWRSAMSGGRATVHHNRQSDGGTTIRQMGDICSVSPEGHQLTDHYFIECKFYASLDLANFFVKGTGKLAEFWRRASRDAIKHNRLPMLIAKQNRYPPLILIDSDFRGVMAVNVPLQCRIGLFDNFLENNRLYALQRGASK